MTMSESFQPTAMEYAVPSLPEACVSLILSFTSPLDACRAAAVSSSFLSAAQSDVVWSRFLPPDYLHILSRLVSPLTIRGSSKKELYFLLCSWVLLDGGKLGFSLDRPSGNKCYTLPARELMIVWSDVPEYWRWIPLRSSRFQEVAELLGVNWLEIHGKIRTGILSPRTVYIACLVLKFVEGASGLDQSPLELSVMVKGTLYKNKGYLLIDERERQRRLDMLQLVKEKSGTVQARERIANALQELARRVKVSRARDDGWMEIELGEFFVSEEDGEVEMSLVEVKGANLKKGMIIEGIEIRPKLPF